MTYEARPILLYDIPAVIPIISYDIHVIPITLYNTFDIAYGISYDL